MTEKQPSQWQNDKWLAAAIWFILLIAVLVTSVFGAQAIFAGGSSPGILTILFSGVVGEPEGIDTEAKVLAVVVTVVALSAAINIVLAWLKFAQISRRLIISFAWLEEQTEESTFFMDLLDYSTALDELAEEEGPDLDLVENTLICSTIRHLGYAWLFMLIFLPVFYIVLLLLN